MKIEKIDYEPSKREVLGEMFKGTLNGAKSVAKGVKEFSTYFVGVTLELNACPYVLPSVIIGLSEPVSKKITNTEGVGGTFGFFAGFLGLGGQVYGYYYLASHDHPEALAVPVITNAVFGFYEMYRSAKNRLVEDCKSQVKLEGIANIVERETSKNVS